MNLHYINLKSRTDRNELMIKNWSEIVALNRVDGVLLEKEQWGTKGCFEGHKKAFESVKNTAKIRSRDAFHIIAEDDIIPAKNFNEKLIQKAFKDLFYYAADWSVLMVGFNVTQQSSFKQASAYLAKAEKFVVAGHCYIVNPKFYDTWEKELNNPKHENNLDCLLIDLQLKHNVYMCVPSLCYQYESYSDNSKMIVGNTESTKKYFVE